MSEQSNADLIDKLRIFAGEMQNPRASLMRDAAERLEAADKRAEEAVSQRNRAYRQRDEEREAKEGNVRALNRVARDRDEYAAVVEKVRDWAEEPGDADEIAFADLNSILATAPADALRELKADVWDEGEEAGAKNQANWDGWRDTKPPITNPYREEQS